MNIVRKFSITAGRVIMLNLAGIVVGSITSAARLFEEKPTPSEKAEKDTPIKRRTFRSV